MLAYFWPPDVLRTINSLGLMGSADMHIRHIGHSKALDRWRYCCAVGCVTISAVCSFPWAPAIRCLLSAQTVDIAVLGQSSTVTGLVFVVTQSCGSECSQG